MSEYDVAGIVCWAVVLLVMVPREWALALYRSPFGRIWDGLVRVIDRTWSVIVRAIVRAKR